MKLTPANAQHIGARKEQQDSFAFSDPGDAAFMAHGGLLAVVADGMGGLANGRQASSSATRTFLSEYVRKNPGESIGTALDRAFGASFRAVAAFNRQTPDCVGSTLAAAVAHNGFLHWIALGDSHLYLIRNGELAQLNRDHNYGERLLGDVARGKLSRVEALDHPERSHLTAFLGMSGQPTPDRNIVPFQLAPGDDIVLCSDGVYNALTAAEITSAFRAEPREACETVKRRVLAKRLDQQDNLTIVAFRCNGDLPRRSHAREVAFAAAVLVGANAFVGARAWDALRAARGSAPSAIPQRGPVKKLIAHDVTVPMSAAKTIRKSATKNRPAQPDTLFKSDSLIAPDQLKKPDTPAPAPPASSVKPRTDGERKAERKP